MTRCEGALGAMILCYNLKHISKNFHKPLPSFLTEIGAALVPMLFSNEILEQFASVWALVWLGECQTWIPPAEPDLLGQLFMLWRHSPENDVQYYSAWALSSQLFVPRGHGRLLTTDLREEFEQLIRRYRSLDNIEQAAALILAWHLSALSDEEIAQKIQVLIRRSKPSSIPSSLQTILGELSF